MEEGTQAECAAAGVRPRRRRAHALRFFASSLRRDDRVGAMVEDVIGNDELEEVAPIETTLPVEKRQRSKLVPVNLQAAVTAIGTLELRCLEKGGAGKWKLELNVRMKE